MEEERKVRRGNRRAAQMRAHPLFVQLINGMSEDFGNCVKFPLVINAYDLTNMMYHYFRTNNRKNEFFDFMKNHYFK